VLVVGSGSLTHNLHEFFGAPANDIGYVSAFARWVREAVEAGDAERLIGAVDDSPYGRRAHPTPDHFWPLLVAAGAAASLASSTVVDGGVAHGILAMDSFVFGAALPV
jgi:4,5-DOPA dioxygenase extradiol